MIYNEDTEREQLRIQLNMLFAEFKTNLCRLCREKQLNYNRYNNMLCRGHIDHEEIQTLIHTIAPDRFIQQRNGKLVIAKRF
jgi:hypothetical protein